MYRSGKIKYPMLFWFVSGILMHYLMVCVTGRRGGYFSTSKLLEQTPIPLRFDAAGIPTISFVRFIEGTGIVSGLLILLNQSNNGMIALFCTVIIILHAIRQPLQLGKSQKHLQRPILAKIVCL